MSTRLRRSADCLTISTHDGVRSGGTFGDSIFDLLGRPLSPARHCGDVRRDLDSLPVNTGNLSPGAEMQLGGSASTSARYIFPSNPRSVLSSYLFLFPVCPRYHTLNTRFELQFPFPTAPAVSSIAARHVFIYACSIYFRSRLQFATRYRANSRSYSYGRG